MYASIQNKQVALRNYVHGEYTDYGFFDSPLTKYTANQYNDGFSMSVVGIIVSLSYYRPTTVLG